mmetsp:Transcript_33187/g.130653  ORF Transcript_33187/g.130653 Transcript_33187/m.130653 type:complete len:81 (+) Transcript_33187:274-516(+)
MEFKYELSIEMPNGMDAEIPKKVLEVDEELRPDLVSRRVWSEGGTLKAVIEAVDAKVLRVSVSSFLDYLILTMRMVQEFS